MIKAIIISAALIGSSTFTDEEAFQILDDQTGIKTYNMFCEPDRFHVPWSKERKITQEQYQKYGESGRFDSQFSHWLEFIGKKSCQEASRYWILRGYL